MTAASMTMILSASAVTDEDKKKQELTEKRHQENIKKLLEGRPLK